MHRHRKSHLWGAYEHSVFTPGDGSTFKAFKLKCAPENPIGLGICFEMEFPEVSRMLAVDGAKVRDSGKRNSGCKG